MKIDEPSQITVTLDCEMLRETVERIARREDRTLAGRYQQRGKRAKSVTVERNGTPISTIEMCALGARLKSGAVTLSACFLHIMQCVRLPRRPCAPRRALDPGTERVGVA